MLETVKLIEPVGEPDMAVVAAYCEIKHLPPPQMEWVCQHSCAPETIPGCTDSNCEASQIVSEAHVAIVRSLVEEGDLAAFDAVSIKMQLNISEELAKMFESFLRAHSGYPEITATQFHCEMTGSLLTFAQLSQLQLDPILNEDCRKLLIEIENTLTAKFNHCAAALMKQRFVDLRADQNLRGNVIVLLAYPDGPILLAWEDVKPKYRKKDSLATHLSAAPVATKGFGLLASSSGEKLDFTNRDLQAIPGDCYGPSLRLIFRVDQEVAHRVHEICEQVLLSCSDQPTNLAMLDVLKKVCLELKLPVLVGGLDQPRLFLKQMLWALPFPALKTKSADPKDSA